MEKFDTHKFLFTLNYQNDIKDHIIEYEDKDLKIKKIKISKINISPSPITCQIYDQNDKKHIIAFIRIKKIYKKNKLVWDNSENKTDNLKIIKGYKK